MISTLIVSQALLEHQDGVSLHPDLFSWRKKLLSYRQTWFESSDKNPLGWYAALCDKSASALLLDQCPQSSDDTRQCWVVSPYHAQLANHKVRVHPEGLFPWSAEDAEYLCTTLNPLIADDGMRMISIGAALLLFSREPMQAYPQAFGEISGGMLPDRHHKGEDGGRLNRLLSEIQMLLFQHPSLIRHDRGEPDVSGIWLWSPLNVSEQGLAVATDRHIAVATRNPVLQSIVEGRDATVIITEAERMHELLKQGDALPKRIVLAGGGHAVLLKKSIFPKFGMSRWVPKSIKQEPNLLATMRAYL